MKKSLAAAVVAFVPLIGQAADPLQICQKAVEARDFAAAAQTAAAQSSFAGAMCAGRAQQAIDDYPAATGSFAKAEQLAGDTFDQVIAITFLARSVRAAGKPDEALAHYERSLKLARDIKQTQAQWANLNETGQIYQEKGDFKAALGRYTEAHRYAANDNERSESNQLLAAAWHQAGNHDRAIEYQLKSVILEERSGETSHYLGAKLQLAVYALSGNDYYRSNKELDDVLKVSREVGSAYWEARASLQLARQEKSRGNQEQAKALLKSAAELAGKSGVDALVNEIKQEAGQQ